jgi:hypothetical protein
LTSYWQLVKRAHIQVVTSGFRPIPLAWATLLNLQLVVSIDGLQPEHDVRRKRATYERILRHIQGHHIAVHCTITSAMVKAAVTSLMFVDFWSANSSVEKIWMSIFTPQRGAANAECLTPDQRRMVIETLLRVRQDRPKLDMPVGMIKEFLSPPASPDRCIFAQSTHKLSADLRTLVEPCQFGGHPDCSRCGCMASMGLAAVRNRKLLGPITAGHIFWTSMAIGRQMRSIEGVAGRRFTKLRLGQLQNNQQRTLSKILGTDFHGR